MRTTNNNIYICHEQFIQAHFQCGRLRNMATMPPPPLPV